MGRLVVHTSFNWMAFLLTLTGPKVTINGRPADVRWGQAPFDLPAGNYHVEVVTRYLGGMGPAALPVAVYPGQLTTVYYRPPAVLGMKGAIGFTPQKTPGMPVLMALMAVMVFFVILSFVV